MYGSRVYVATENDTIYSLDAATGAVVWKAHVATPESSGTAPCGDIGPTIGITGTPVIDPAANRIYAVAAVAGSGGSVTHQLFAVDLGTGAVLPGFPVNADPPGDNPVNILQRPALTLQGNRVLAGYGGNDGDCASYHGWLVSVSTTGGAKTSFEADPSAGNHGGAIWGAGAGPALDANGNWKTLDNTDADSGSSEPVLLPNNLILESGKDGNASVHAFWIGDASCPAGATLQLSESAFRRATLTTFDGDDFFIVRIQLGRLEILVQDQASGTP